MSAYLAALALAIGLALDTGAVAAARATDGRRSPALPWVFGVAHVGMATLGWLGGKSAVAVLARWHHWVAFAVLVVLGGRMIVAAKPDAGEPATEDRWGIVVLALVTSLDALAAGLAIDTIGVSPAVVIPLIGGVCVAVTALAAAIARRAHQAIGHGLSRLGGVVLIAVAVRIVVLHAT